jgi:sterol desaturase/sphingolipid hydroxylase (fatty acid hydroxylase superfamily)
MIGPYLINGRLQRIAFERKERLVKKLIIVAGATSKASDLLSAVNHSLVFIKKASQKQTFFSDSQWNRIKWVMFILLAGLIAFVSIILTIFFGMSQIIFNVLLLYRNFKVYLPSLKSFEDTVDDTVDAVVNLLNMSYLKDLAYPFIYLINAISDIHIDLSAVQVSCAGAQAPGLLLINVVIVGIVIIIIRSDIQSYWAVAQTKLL